MLLFESLLPTGCEGLRIDATDLEENSQFANTIATGTYASGLLKGSPHQELLAKYTVPSARAGYVEFGAELRKCIFYQRHDLLSLRPIGSKNVLLHLTYDQRVKVITMFHEALSPGGYLALDEFQELPFEVSPLFERGLGACPRINSPDVESIS
jgi:chemotaxis protein methyltransferase CheR